MKKVFNLTISAVMILSILLSIFMTPWFSQHTNVEKEVISLLDDVQGKYLIMGSPFETSYTKAYYSYGAIYNDLSTSSGWARVYITEEYNELTGQPMKLLKEKDCSGFISTLNELQTTEVIAYNEDCQTLEECKLEKIKSGEVACLYALSPN